MWHNIQHIEYRTRFRKYEEPIRARSTLQSFQWSKRNSARCSQGNRALTMANKLLQFFSFFKKNDRKGHLSWLLDILHKEF